MPNAILLDTGPLGMVVHPRKHPDIKIWVQHALHASYSIVVPEIADYEVRRELLRINAVASLRRLDDLKSATLYLPLSTSTMLRAASLWAQLRNAGIPTAVDTATNVKHINRLVPAQLWHEIIF